MGRGRTFRQVPPSGSKPGDARTVMLVPIAGERIVHGLQADKSEEEKHLDAGQD